MGYQPLSDDATEFTLQPVEIDAPDVVYPRHILDWRRPYLAVRDGLGTVWLTGIVATAEQDVQANRWRFTLDSGVVLDVRFTSGCASCGGNSPRPKF